MTERTPRTIEMTVEGEFVVPPSQQGQPGKPAPRLWALKLGVGAAIVAALAGVLAIAAVFLWVASVMIPVALVAGVVAYGAFRFQAWRLRRRT